MVPAAEESPDYWQHLSGGIQDESFAPGGQVSAHPAASGQFLDQVNEQLYPPVESPVLHDALQGLDNRQAHQALEEAATILFPEQFPVAPPQPVAASGFENYGAHAFQEPEEPVSAISLEAAMPAATEPSLESSFYATPTVEDFNAIVQPDAPTLSPMQAPVADLSDQLGADSFMDFSAPPDFGVPTAPAHDPFAEPTSAVASAMDFSAPPDFGVSLAPVHDPFAEPASAVASAMDFSAPPDFGVPVAPAHDPFAEPTSAVASVMDFSAPPDFGVPVAPAHEVLGSHAGDGDLFGDMTGSTLTLDDMPDPLSAVSYPDFSQPEQPQPTQANATFEAPPSKDVSLVFDGFNPVSSSSSSVATAPAPAAAPVNAYDPSTWDIRNLRILATCPLDRKRQLLLVQNEAVLAVMADNGNQHVSVLKVFQNNPTGANQNFSAVREGGVGDKEMFLVMLGSWQAIVSADAQGVVLHTELTA